MVLDLEEALEGVWVEGWVGVVLVIILCPFCFYCIIYHGGWVCEFVHICSFNVNL